MSVATARHFAPKPGNKAVSLFRDKSQKYKQQKKPQSKPIPWVDVSDEEPRHKDDKNPLKRNGAVVNGQEQGQRRKKPRHSSNGEQKDSSSGAGPSSASKASAIQQQRKDLPIAQGREALIEEIRANDVTVLLGETGSGKTTRKSHAPRYHDVTSYLEH
jgi:ATP-dependent RNA helicase DHX33